jgi:glycosyltransferase involved in cell wall biosynthesis
MGKPVVSICVPAYRAEAFIAETLDSALAQTWPVELVVSVDAGGDGTAAAVRRHAGEAVRIVEQPRRLGWIGNVNAALASARTPFAMLLPHDDLIAADYVAACMDALAAEPGAALAYSDLAFIGQPEAVIREPSAKGRSDDRLAAFAQRHFDAVAFRGVFPRRKAHRHRVPGFAIAGFAADTLFVARMAAQGDIVRVPQTLYRKRLLPESVHRSWHRATADELDEMWIVHCLELLRVIAQTRPRALLHPAVGAALRSRLLREEVRFYGSGVPRQLRPGSRLLPQMLRVYAEVARRRPHYSWC